MVSFGNFDNWKKSGKFQVQLRSLAVANILLLGGPTLAKSIQKKHSHSDCKVLAARESRLKGWVGGGTVHPPPNTGEHPLP